MNLIRAHPFNPFKSVSCFCQNYFVANFAYVDSQQESIYKTANAVNFFSLYKPFLASDKFFTYHKDILQLRPTEGHMVSSQNVRRHFSVAALLINCIFLLFYFFYFYFRFDAKLIYQAQQPVFYFDSLFYRDFFSIPGGMLDLFSGFLSQFFYWTWSGALSLTLVFGLVALSGWLLIRLINTKTDVLFIHWLPTIFFFVQHHDYDFSLSITLGFVLTLISVFLFIRFTSQNFALRFLSFIFSYSLLYYIAGGPALLFTLIIVFYNVLIRRSLWAFAYIIVAVAVPWLGQSFLFIVPLDDAYVVHLGDFLTLSAWPLYLSYLYVPFFILVEKLSRHVKIIEVLYQKIQSKNLIVFGIKSIVFIGLLFFIATSFFQKKQKALWQMDYHARHQQWQDVIDVVQKGQLTNVYIGQFQLHRALYFTGQLCESMFVFPQPIKSDALFLHPTVRHFFPLQYSDLYFDLGLINEAQHWAHEALSVTGDAPCNLQRLAEVNILKGEYEVAKKCLRQLRKSMWHKKWANDMWMAMAQSNFTAFPYMALKKTLMLSEDFIITPTQPQECLEKLLAANSANQMAFEYNMATLMLEGQVGQLIKQLDGMNNFAYIKTPRHIEEAILLYIANTDRRDFPPPPTGLSPATIKAFRDYVAITKKYPDPTSAYRELSSKYGDTFWFYANYIYKRDS